MTTDRDQIRLDAETTLNMQPVTQPEQTLARHCLDLLADLERAEELARHQATEIDADATRLAAADGLVQILHRYYDAMALERGAGRPLDDHTYTLLLNDAREALAAWNGSQ